MASTPTSWNVTSASKKPEFYIPSLDGLRAIAVMIVFFSHVGLKGRIPGGFGVTIFFFLSGFLITTLLRREMEGTGRVSLRKFYLRRVLRIFPPMYLVLGLAALATVFVGEYLSPRVLVLQVFHLTNYHVAFDGTGAAIGTEVLWSLAVEEHFYLLFPLAFIALFSTARPRRLPVILLVVCAGVLVWRYIALTQLELSPTYTTHVTDTRIDSILFGCVLALWRNPAVSGPRFSPALVWGAFSVAILVLGATLVARDVLFRETARYTLQGLALAPVFIAAVSFPRALPFRFLNLTPVRWLGLISYSLYLIHYPIIRVLEVRFQLHGPVLTVTSLVVSIAASTVIYRAVEKPCARLRKRLSAGASAIPSVTRGTRELP